MLYRGHVIKTYDETGEMYACELAHLDDEDFCHFFPQAYTVDDAKRWIDKQNESACGWDCDSLDAPY